MVGFVLLYAFRPDTINDQFKKMKTFTHIIRLISTNYVEDVDINDIMEGAIVGLLDKLDPHSSYISSDQFESINEQFVQSFKCWWTTFNHTNIEINCHVIETWCF